MRTTIKQRLAALERRDGSNDERDRVLHAALEQHVADMGADGTAPTVEEMEEYIARIPDNWPDLSSVKLCAALPRDSIEDYRKMFVFLALLGSEEAAA